MAGLPMMVMVAEANPLLHNRSMMQISRLFAASAMCCVLSGIPFLRPAQACSVNHINSAAEITAKAEQIVRVQVVKATPPKPGETLSGQVIFKVLEVLKGRLESDSITLSGQIDKYDGPNDKKPPYDFVRPGG